MPKEVELKLALPASSMRHLARHPLLAGQAPRNLRLANVYFDTDDQALRAAGVALRVRRQGRQWLQTVKLGGTAGAGLTSRPEWETPFDGRLDFAAVDDVKLRRRLTRLRDADRLQPAFETNFRRRTWTLDAPSGGTVLLMADEGEVVAGPRREPIAELELELDGGTVADLFALAHILARTLPLKPEARSKAERGYRLAGGVTPAPVTALSIELDARLSPRAAFTAIAHACVAQLQANEAGALTSDDPEYVHQMRVALRRLRAAMRTFRPVLPAELLEQLSPPLRELAAALGAVRDLDVLLAEVVAPALDAPRVDAGLAALVDELTAARDAARLEARRYLGSHAYGNTLLLLGEALAQLSEPEATDAPPLPAFAAKRLTRLHRRVMALAAAAHSGRAEDLHLLRIGIKRLRYALDAFAPLFRGHAARRMGRQLARLQGDLGYLNDLAVAGPRLLDAAGMDPARITAVAWIAGHHAAAYGRIRAGLDRAVTKLEHMPAPWKRT